MDKQTVLIAKRAIAIAPRPVHVGAATICIPAQRHAATLAFRTHLCPPQNELVQKPGSGPVQRFILMLSVDHCQWSGCLHENWRDCPPRGLSRDTIRFYERNGLIASSSAAGSTNSYRNYTDDVLERLSMIREAQAAGLSIADLGLLVRQLENATSEGFDAEAFLDLKIVEIENRIQRSERFLQTLKETREALKPAGARPTTSDGPSGGTPATESSR